MERKEDRGMSGLVNLERILYLSNHEIAALHTLHIPKALVKLIFSTGKYEGE